MKRGSLRLDNHNGPLICVGPGTGVYPLRAMIRERASIDVEENPQTVFVHGCRHRDKDFLCESEWNARLENKTLSELVTAFSRINPKIYVQTWKAQNSKKIWDCVRTVRL